MSESKEIMKGLALSWAGAIGRKVKDVYFNDSKPLIVFVFDDSYLALKLEKVSNNEYKIVSSVLHDEDLTDDECYLGDILKRCNIITEEARQEIIHNSEEYALYERLREKYKGI